MAGTTQDAITNENAYDEHQRILVQQGESGEDR